jgi:uncharacterized DUF497 family protein
MKVIARVKLKVQQGKFEFSDHALDELDRDRFTIADAVKALRNGRHIETFTEDYPVPRHIIVGTTADGRYMELVCCFLSNGNLRIITIYDVS